MKKGGIAVFCLLFIFGLVLGCGSKFLKDNPIAQKIHKWQCPQGCINYVAVNADPGILENYFDTSNTHSGETDIGGILRTKSKVKGQVLEINLDKETYGLTQRANDHFKTAGLPINLQIVTMAPDRKFIIRLFYTD